jgi:hypothetical protein
VESVMSETAGAASPVNTSGTIQQFVIKTCIVAVVISACAIFVSDWLIQDVKESLALPRGGPVFWAKLERALDRAAGSHEDLPPEKKQKLINDVRTIVARWRPFLDAIQNELQKPTLN